MAKEFTLLEMSTIRVISSLKAIKRLKMALMGLSCINQLIQMSRLQLRTIASLTMAKQNGGVKADRRLVDLQ